MVQSSRSMFAIGRVGVPRILAAAAEEKAAAAAAAAAKQGATGDAEAAANAAAFSDDDADSADDAEFRDQLARRLEQLKGEKPIRSISSTTFCCIANSGPRKPTNKSNDRSGAALAVCWFAGADGGSEGADRRWAHTTLCGCSAIMEAAPA